MLSFGWIWMFGKNKTRRSIAFTVPTLLFIISITSYVILSPILPPSLFLLISTSASMVSPLFSAVASHGSHTLGQVVYSYSCPCIPPSPVAVENPCLTPLQHLLAFPILLLLSISFFHFFSLFFVSSVYFCLLTLSCYPLRKWHIRALFLWADLQHRHLKCCHEVRLPCYCSFFSIAYANCLDSGQKVS